MDHNYTIIARKIKLGVYSIIITIINKIGDILNNNVSGLILSGGH